MTTNQINIIHDLIVIALLAGFGYTLSLALEALSSKVKNENIRAALHWASQAVLFAQEYIAKGPDQHRIAVQDLRRRLTSNKKLKRFTDEEIESYIRQAYAINKTQGVLDVIKTDKDPNDLP